MAILETSYPLYRPDQSSEDEIPTTVLYRGSVPAGRSEARYSLEMPVESSMLTSDSVLCIVNGLGVQERQYGDLRHEIALKGRACITVDPAESRQSSQSTLASLGQSYIDSWNDLLKSKERPSTVDLEKLELVGHSMGATVSAFMSERDYRPASIIIVSGARTEEGTHIGHMAVRSAYYLKELLGGILLSGDAQTAGDNLDLVAGQAFSLLRNPKFFLGEVAVASSFDNVNRLVRLSEEEGVVLGAILCMLDKLIEAKRLHPDLRAVIKDNYIEVEEEHHGPITRASRFAEYIVNLSKQMKAA